MSLSSDQKKGVALALVSFALLLAFGITWGHYPIAYSQYCLIIIFAFVLFLTLFWGVAMALTPPDSEESVATTFRRLIAGGKGVAIKTERDIEQEEMDKTAVDLDDEQQVNKL